MGAKSGKNRKPAAGQAKKSAGSKRLALIVFGALFAVLFAGYAIAVGIEPPSVPSGDVAMVQTVPADISNVSEAEYKRAFVQQVAGKELKKTPKPGSKKYEEVKTGALGELLNVIWIKGESEELGLSVTDKQVEEKLAEIKKTNFPTTAQYNEFLKTSHLTQEEVDEKVELQLLTEKIQEIVPQRAPAPTNAEIAEKYEEEKATAYTTKPSRDVRIVTSKEKSQVEKALELLEEDDSAANWKKVAAKYSSDPSTKTKGGLQPGLTEELLQTAGPLKKAIFDSATGELVGPVKFQENYFVVEVEKLNPEKVQTLGEARSQVSTALTQEKQQAYFSEFVTEFQSKWESRTLCASGFVTEQCANYKAPAHAPTAAPGCYEANPKAPAKECPAPVIQNTPAIPGTTTLLKPQGERLVQRPQPVGLKESSGVESTALPEGVTPETGE